MKQSREKVKKPHSTNKYGKSPGKSIKKKSKRIASLKSPTPSKSPNRHRNTKITDFYSPHVQGNSISENKNLHSKKTSSKTAKASKSKTQSSAKTTCIGTSRHLLQKQLNASAGMECTTTDCSISPSRRSPRIIQKESASPTGTPRKSANYNKPKLVTTDYNISPKRRSPRNLPKESASPTGTPRKSTRYNTPEFVTTDYNISPNRRSPRNLPKESASPTGTPRKSADNNKPEYLTTLYNISPNRRSPRNLPNESTSPTGTPRKSTRYNELSYHTMSSSSTNRRISNTILVKSADTKDRRLDASSKRKFTVSHQKDRRNKRIKSEIKGTSVKKSKQRPMQTFAKPYVNKSKRYGIKQNLEVNSHNKKLSPTRKSKGTSSFVSQQTARDNSSKPKVATSPRYRKKSCPTKFKTACDLYPNENDCDVETNAKDRESSTTPKVRRKINFECNTNRKEKRDKKTDKETSKLFQKYGICVPSYQEILRQRKDCDSYTQLIDSLEQLVAPLPDIKRDIPEVQIGENNLQNCKHMSIDSLDFAFTDNLQYLNAIRNGTVPCERHDMYKNILLREKMAYNPSMILFTNEQKQVLASKLCDRYGSDSASTDYNFKVLLPELCLKIFMDEYKMPYEKARVYLE